MSSIDCNVSFSSCSHFSNYLSLSFSLSHNYLPFLPLPLVFSLTQLSSFFSSFTNSPLFFTASSLSSLSPHTDSYFRLSFFLHFPPLTLLFLSFSFVNIYIQTSYFVYIYFISFDQIHLVSRYKTKTISYTIILKVTLQYCFRYFFWPRYEEKLKGKNLVLDNI